MKKTVIGIVSGKGGVGKSVIAVNLSALLSDSKVENLLIDADTTNPSICLHLGLVYPSSGLQDVLAGKKPLERSVLLHPPTGLRVLPSPLKYEGPTEVKNLKKVLDGVRSYEFILIDCPPSLLEYVQTVIKACDEVLIVTTPDLPSATSATKIVEFARKHGIKPRGIVLNRVLNKRFELHPREIAEMTECPVIATIPDDQAVLESVAVQMPVVLYKPSSPASIQLRKLASKIAESVIEEAHEKQSLFSRIVRLLKRLLHLR